MAGTILGGISQDVTLADVKGVLENILRALGANDNGKMLVSVAAAPAVVAVSESGTWTVQPGNTPNTSAWLTQNPAASTSLYGVQGSQLDAHYQSISAFQDAARSKITVS